MSSSPSAALPRSVVSKPLGQYNLANDSAGTVLVYIQPITWPSGAIRDRVYACEAGAHETDAHEVGGTKWIFVRCSALRKFTGQVTEAPTSERVAAPTVAKLAEKWAEITKDNDAGDVVWNMAQLPFAAREG